MNLLSIQRWFKNSPEPSTTEACRDTFSPGNLKNIKDLCLKLYSKLKEVNTFNYLHELGNSENKTFYMLGEKPENDFTALLLLVSMENLMKEKNELYDKIEWLEMHVNNLSVPLKRVFSPAALELELQKNKLEPSLYCWLNYSENSSCSLRGCQQLK